MSKTNFLSWDTVAGNNQDVGGISILGSAPVSNFDGGLREVMAQLRSGVDGKTVYASKTGNYTALAADNNAVHRYTSTATVSLTAAATLGSGWHYTVMADGAAVTIDPNASETINGLTTLPVPNGTTATIICDGSNFFTVMKPNGWWTIGDYTLSAASSLPVTNLSAFRKLRVSGKLFTSAAAFVHLRPSTDNGSTYDSGASDYAYQVTYATSTTTTSGNSNATTRMLISPANNDAGGAVTFELTMEGFNKAEVMGMRATCAFIISGFFGVGTIAGQRNAATAKNAFQISPSTGTFTGTVTVEGMMG